MLLFSFQNNSIDSALGDVFLMKEFNQKCVLHTDKLLDDRKESK